MNINTIIREPLPLLPLLPRFGLTTKLMDAPLQTLESNDAQPARSHAAHGSAWISVLDRVPPDESVIVKVRRKPNAELEGPYEWDMWSCNVRMHTDEVGWWMPNEKLTHSREKPI